LNYDIDDKARIFFDESLQKHRIKELNTNIRNIFDYVCTSCVGYGGEISTIFNAIKDPNVQIPNGIMSELQNNSIAMFYGMVESAIKTSINNSIPYYPTTLDSEAIFTMPFFAPSSKIFLDKINDKKYEEALKLNDFIYCKYNKALRLPILFNFILSKADNIYQLIDIAFELREQKPTKDFKYRCYQINEALENGKQEDALKMIDEIDIYIKNINNTIKQSRFINTIISFLPNNIILPDSNPNKNYLMFLKKIYFQSLSPVMLKNKIYQFFKVNLQ